MRVPVFVYTKVIFLEFFLSVCCHVLGLFNGLFTYFMSECLSYTLRHDFKFLCSKNFGKDQIHPILCTVFQWENIFHLADFSLMPL